ncbi:MAG: S1/P1 nuclease [Burkholderiaceae bacterium]|nr:S1/P1 nuclease [Burkholderiaceae bacterium]
MPRLRFAWLVLLPMLALAAAPARAWDHRGHQAIGSIADRLIAGTPAAARVRELLAGDLQTASVWADCARAVAATPDGWRYANAGSQAACAPFETADGRSGLVDFVARNERHRSWHYTDISIAQPRYDAALPGARPADLVQAIGAALAVLQGGRSPPPFDIAGAREALRLLAHFVGDLHQPLHVGSIYLGDAGQPIDPTTAQQAAAQANAGGNLITLDGRNLHATWDDTPDALSSALASSAGLARARQVPPTAGPLDRWPAAWADDTLAAARQAFDGLQFEPRAGAGWPARADETGYRQRREALQQAQLVKAGARLAQVLAALWP